MVTQFILALLALGAAARKARTCEELSYLNPSLVDGDHVIEVCACQCEQTPCLTTGVHSQKKTKTE